MNRFLTVGLIIVATVAWGAPFGGVAQSGAVTNGNLVKWAGKNKILDGGIGSGLSNPTGNGGSLSNLNVSITGGTKTGGSNGVTILTGPAESDPVAVPLTVEAQRTADRADGNAALAIWLEDSYHGRDSALATHGSFDSVFSVTSNRTVDASKSTGIYTTGTGWRNYRGSSGTCIRFGTASASSVVLSQFNNPKSTSGSTVAFWTKVFAYSADDYYMETWNPWNFHIATEAEGKFRLYADAFCATDPTGSATNVWIHILVTLDASTSELYTNGALAASGAGYSGTTNNVVPTTKEFGANQNVGSSSPNALMDQVCFWRDRKLTTSEITNLYNGGNGRLLSSMIAVDPTITNSLEWCFELEDGSGTTPTSMVRAVTGAFANSPAWVTTDGHPMSIEAANIPVQLVSSNFPAMDGVPSSYYWSAFIQADQAGAQTSLYTYVSRDGGATSNRGAAAEIAYINTDLYMVRGITSVTNQPSGTNMVLQLLAPTNLQLTVKGWAGGF